MIKKVLGILFIVFTFIIVFFFWGSSSVIGPHQYNEISKNEALQAITKTDTFSLITYNLGYLSGMTNNKAVDRTSQLFNDNLTKTQHLFSAINPDFVAFQEIDFNSDRSYGVDQLKELFLHQPFNYSAKAVNWDKTYVPFPYWPISKQFGKIISGQAILSQHEIIGNEIIPLQKPADNPFYYNAFYLDRLAQVSKINIGTSEMVIINLHLEAFHANTRDEQIKTVLREYHKYSEKFPVFLCGDFNSTPPGATTPYQTDHVIQTLLNDFQLEMAIGMEENLKNEHDYFTFNSDQPDRRLDYIFYNPKFIQIIDARVLHEAGQISDHLPVWMKFTLRRNGK